MVGFCWGLLLMVSSVFASPPRPILTIPVHKSEGLPFASVSLRWKYDEDPEISAQIEEQVEEIGLRVYETDNPDRLQFPTPYVGICESYYPCGNSGTCSLEYRHKFAPRTFASTLECGEELKPDQWYRWTVGVFFKDGTYSAKTGAFKTMDWVDQNGYRETVHLDIDLGIIPQITGVTRNGKSHTINSIYRTAGFDLAISAREMPKPASTEEPPTMLEIAKFFKQQPHDYYLSAGTDWYIPIILFKNQQGLRMNFLCSWDINCTKYVGYTFKPVKEKEENGTVYKYTPTAIAVFSDNIKEGIVNGNANRLGMSENQCYLHTLTHELGHGIGMGNKGHSFGDEQGMTIMNDMPHLIPQKWDYVWSAKSLEHFYQKPLEELKPIQWLR